MKLCWSKGSPFVRKVSIALKHHDLWQQTELVETLVWDKNSKHEQFLPIGKIPALETKPGYWLFDSNVICQYVDFIGTHTKLYAHDESRFEQLRLGALADGVLENAVMIMIEKSHRKDGHFWFERHEQLLHRNKLALTELQTLINTLEYELNIATITIVAMADWLMLRGKIIDFNIQEYFPELCNWVETMNHKHQSLQETKPL